MAVFCLKCGKEIPEKRVFCEECLDIMALHPVKPGTPVQLPVRPSQTAVKRSSRRKELSPEQQLKRHKSAIAWLCGLLLASWVGLGVTVAMLFQEQPQQEPQLPAPRSSTLITTNDQP